MMNKAKILLGAMIFPLVFSSAVFPIHAQVKQLKEVKAKPNFCEVRGTIRNVCQYARVSITINDSHVRWLPVHIIIPPGTTEQDFRIPVPCNDEANPWYNLFIHYQKQIGLESIKQYSPGKCIPCRGYGIDVIVKADSPIKTFERAFDFGKYRNSGILLEEMRTDRDNYVFGDVVRLIIRMTIKGPGSAMEEADYTVSISSSGFEFELKKDKTTVRAGQPTIIEIPIHHTYYSRGDNNISLNVQTSEYNFSANKMIRID